jgi:hypothetical protein
MNLTLNSIILKTFFCGIKMFNQKCVKRSSAKQEYFTEESVTKNHP